MTLVIDASVAAKWFLRDAPGEEDADAALAMLRHVVEGDVRALQPPHFAAEVAAVLARLKPRTAHDDVLDLLELPFQVLDEKPLYAAAAALATDLGHHVFDTLYHAVAHADPRALLVTADRRYFRRARRYGQICLLEDWQPPGS